MDYAELLETLRTALGFGTDLLSLNVGGDASEKITEMNQAILIAQSHAIDAQSREMQQADRIRALEEKVAALMEWNVEKENYELKSLGNTAFVYVAKESVDTGEPPFWLCQPCFENAKKSVLQRGPSVEFGKLVWTCHVCKSNYLVGRGAHP